MKYLIFLFFLVSCSMGGKRNPASVNHQQFEIGEIKVSLLRPAEFQDRYGEEWVLMDGQDVSGSEYALISSYANVPDARGKFLRMNNNGAVCEKKGSCEYDPENTSLGSFQPDLFKSHKHSVSKLQNGGNERYANSKNITTLSNQSNAGVKTDSSGGDETRPKNISVNFYIKINSCESSSCK